MKTVFIYITKSVLDSKLTDYFDKSIHITNVDKSNELVLDDNINYIFYAEDYNSREKLKMKYGEKENCLLARPNISYIMENFFMFESWHIETMKN